MNFSSLISVQFLFKLATAVRCYVDQENYFAGKSVDMCEDRRKCYAHANMVIRNIVLRELRSTVS